MCFFSVQFLLGGGTQNKSGVRHGPDVADKGGVQLVFRLPQIQALSLRGKEGPALLFQFNKHSDEEPACLPEGGVEGDGSARMSFIH